MAQTRQIDTNDPADFDPSPVAAIVCQVPRALWARPHDARIGDFGRPGPATSASRMLLLQPPGYESTGEAHQ